MKPKYLLLLVCLLFILSACSNDKSSDSNITAEGKDSVEQKNVNHNKKEEEKEVNQPISAEQVRLFEELPVIPETTKDVIAQEAGKYTWSHPYEEGIYENLIEDLKKLEPLPEDAGDEERDKYFRYMYSLVANDFPAPQDLIKKWKFSISGNPDLPESKFGFKENYNIEIILDSSGSMAADMGGQTRMELAKQSVQNFLSSIPAEANVSRRVYGHKGSNSESDKKESCKAIEQVYPFGSYQQDKFSEALNQFQPTGWTPIADALKKSHAALAQLDSNKNTNLVYLVSDGIETCDGDPVQVAEQLSKSKANPIINIIGFLADSEAQKQLKEMARVSDGVYSTVNNQQGLEEEFNRAREVLDTWERWKMDAMLDVTSTRLDNTTDIMDLNSSWGTKADDQSSDLGDVFSFAREHGIITGDQQSEFRSKKNEIDKVIRKAQKEVRASLEELNAEKIEELEKSIEEKYSEETNNEN